MIFIGIDDTDNHESRGTGQLARAIAGNLPAGYQLLGVTRHQLLVDDRVPYTSHNSSAAICIQGADGEDMERRSLAQIFALAREMMLADFQPGSDPGLCVADAQMANDLVEWGLLAQKDVVKQSAARQLAQQTGVLLEGLGGSQDGVIGALAAVGLAASGEDGRYILVGQSRTLSGLMPVQVVMAAGIADICTLDGSPVRDGMILADKLRPARRGGKPVQYVQRAVIQNTTQEYWEPLKLD